MERAILVISALLLNALFGGLLNRTGLTRISHMPELLLRVLERKLNREHRSLAHREQRGTLLAIVMLIAGLLLGVAAQAVLTQDLRFIGLGLLALLLPVGSSWSMAARVRKKLLAHDMQGARAILVRTRARAHLPADSYGLVRASIEFMAMQFTGQLLTPILGYLLFGWPGLLLCKAVCLMEAAWARPPKRSHGFGKAANALYELLLILPSRLGALFWLTAGLFLPGSKMKKAWRTLLPLWLTANPRQMILAAPAVILNLSLGGLVSFYFEEQWIGTGTPMAVGSDLKQAMFLFVIMSSLLLPLLWLFTL